jgi:iron complex transport system substrate-binding protein
MRSLIKMWGLTLVAMILFVGACSPSTSTLHTSMPIQSQATSFTITDAVGRVVSLPKLPERIAIAGRASTLLADATYLFPEAKERVVAVSTTNQGAGDFLESVDPNFKQKIAYDTNAGAEQVAVTQPDLVLMKSYMAETLGAPLELLSIPVIYLDLETPEQYQRDLLTIGKIFNNESRAQELTQYYQDRVDQVTKAVSKLSEQDRPRILLLYHSDRDGQVAFNVPPIRWLQTMMVELAGGSPVWKDIELGNGWTKVSLEQIAAWNADQIYLISYTDNPEEIIGQLYTNPQWLALKAVQNKALYAFPKDYYSWDQPDPRWILGLRWLAWRIHPQETSNPDMVHAAQDFFNQWYGIDQATFDHYLHPRLQGSFE